MEPRVLVLCLLSYIACASVIPPPAEIAEVVGNGSLARARDDPLIIAVRAAGNGSDDDKTDKFRDKRALGLLLSGLAQIFGYMTSPIQIASLPNPNATAGMTMPAMPAKQTARPPAMNATAPRQQETIRFTGVVNFGNNSDIIGHLQRYERIFHSNATTAAAKMTTPRPAPSPPPPPPTPTKLSVDLRTTNVGTKPPLLAPFFVKIPLPIAPDLLPIGPPVQDLSYPLVPTVSETSEEAPPVRKEQEMVYRNSEDTERYMVEQKDIYDEKDVRKPASKFTHQLYVDDPRWQKQQEDRYNEVQREREGHVEQLKEQEDERERGRDDHRHREDEIDERQRYREQEVAQRNREQIRNYEPTEGRRPAAADDENDAEEVDEDSTRDNQQERLPSEPARRPPAKKNEPEQTNYADYDDREDEQERPAPPADKHVVVGYDQQLPIGDYFHEGNADEIRDSYGEVLDKKKQEDDRLSGYFSMFKHPYTALDSQEEVRDAEDAPRENSGTADAAYDEHLVRLEKLREEYAPPAPQSKYEEYDLNDESEADGADDGQSETARNRAPAASSTRTKSARGGSRAKSNGNQPIDDDDDDAKPSRQEIDVSHYTPLIVPVRYVDIDTVDKTAEQTATRPPKYEKPNGSVRSANNDRIVAEDNAAAVIDGTQLTAQIVSPARPRQLHEEGERDDHKNFQLWPTPFDYAFDNTEQTNAVLPPATRHHPAHYRPIVTDVAANDASESTEQPSGYLVVIGDPYQHYPHNIYYVPNEEVRTQDPDSQPNAEGTHPQQRFSPLPRANADRHTLVRAYPSSLTASSLNETANDGNPRADYYRPRQPPVRVPDRYGYIFGERAERAASEQPDERSSLFSTNNWSSKIYPSPPIPLRNIASLSRDTRGDSSDRQSSRKQKSVRSPTERPNGEREETATTPLRRSSPRRRKPFDDPQSAHDFFGFSKNDYGFDGESEASEVGGAGARRDSSSVPVAPEPAAIAYRHDESLARQADEPENDPEKAKVTEYRNKVATLRVSEQRRLTPNGPIHYVDFMRNI